MSERLQSKQGAKYSTLTGGRLISLVIRVGAASVRIDTLGRHRRAYPNHPRLSIRTTLNV